MSYNPLISLARNAKLRHMEMQCDPQWVLDLAAERDELRTALTATDKLASEAAQRNEEMGRSLELLRRDAERYRWLRDNQYPYDWEYFGSGHELADEEIDAAIQSQQAMKSDQAR